MRWTTIHMAIGCCKLPACPRGRARGTRSLALPGFPMCVRAPPLCVRAAADRV
jgi:hypothetical protein